MEKVKLPRKVAEAIERFREHYKSGAEYDLELIRDEGLGYTNVISNFVRESRENLANYFKALVNGYEVEETPEDKVRSMYDELESFGIGEEKRVLIRKVLNAYGYKVQGVNA